jgi:hypothetical protein
MAGHGRAPKPKAQRRNGHAPLRGEWVDLEPLVQPLLGEADEGWPGHVKTLWEAWRADPVTSQYGSADLAAVRELARRYDSLAANEQRLRMDGLGLTPKGKRDLRWRTPAEVETIRRQPATVSKLRVVAT